MTKLRTIHKSLENIHASLQAFNTLKETSIIVLACAVNGRIIAELCSELFLLQDGFLRSTSATGSRGGRGRFIPGPANVPGRRAPEPMSATMENLWDRMKQLKFSGKIDKVIYHHFQTLRLIGNKSVHSTVMKATTVHKSLANICAMHLVTLHLQVDLAAIVLAVRGILLCPLFSGCSS